MYFLNIKTGLSCCLWKRLFLFHFALSVCGYQFAQLFSLAFELLSQIGISNQHPLGHIVYDRDQRRVEYLGAVRLQRAVRLMFSQRHVSGVDDECVPRDAGLFLICLRHSAVDDEQFVAAFDKALSILDLDRNMSVQDDGCLRIETELLENLFAYLASFYEFIVRNRIVVLGLSGGLDSFCFFDVLFSLKEDLGRRTCAVF